MTKIVTCPNCGKTLDIPEELTAYSCLYCGVRTELTAVPKADDGQFEEARSALKPKLITALSGYGDYYKKITRKVYAPSFAVYEDETKALLRELDACVALCPQGQETGASLIAEDFVEEIISHMKATGRWEQKHKRGNYLFETRVLLALYLTPAIRKQGLACSEEFRSSLKKAWLCQFPDQEWTPGDYDVLIQGYKKRKLCFITTAVCEGEGKPDDCRELTMLRRFRDGYMTERGDSALIEEYYDLAPAIVICIRLCDKPEQRYSEIRTRWLEPCLAALEQNEPERCRDTYIDMVRTLQRRYFS